MILGANNSFGTRKRKTARFSSKKSHENAKKTRAKRASEWTFEPGIAHIRTDRKVQRGMQYKIQDDFKPFFFVLRETAENRIDWKKLFWRLFFIRLGAAENGKLE